MARGAKDRSEGAGGRVVVAVVVVLALLVGGLWVGAHYLVGDRVPRGTEIAGVDLGGQTTADAERALADGLADRVREPIQVVVDGRRARVAPLRAGLEVDYSASVAATGAGETWDPRELWENVVGDQELDAVVGVEEEAMASTIDRLTGGLGTPPVDGAISLAGGQVEVTEPVAGRGLDPEEAEAALVASYLSGEPAELGITAVDPEIDAADVETAVAEIAEPALSAPVVLRFGGTRVRLGPEQYAAALAIEPTDGTLALTVDEAVLAALVEDQTADAGEPVDATVEIVDDRPRVVLARPGLGFEPAEVVAAFTGAVTATDAGRRASVEGTVEQPEVTTADVRALGITEKVSDFSTFFPYAEYRNVNLGRAGELIDGTVLQPGETFSLNDIVGERTRENGFTEGFVISDGIYASDLGGGVSQMATTVFNAMFFAGLEDVEHRPHSFYIDRYPVGREATLVFGQLDLRFRNDTDFGVLVDVDVIPSTTSSQGEVRVRMYSTKVWDISSLTSERYAYVAPATRRLDTPDCFPNSGYSGFQVDVTRVFRPVGEDTVDHREVFHTSYTPSDTVICTG